MEKTHKLALIFVNKHFRENEKRGAVGIQKLCLYVKLALYNQSKVIGVRWLNSDENGMGRRMECVFEML